MKRDYLGIVGTSIIFCLLVLVAWEMYNVAVALKHVH